MTDQNSKILERFSYYKDDYKYRVSYYKEYNEETNTISYKKISDYDLSYSVSKQEYLKAKLEYKWFQIKNWDGWRDTIFIFILLFILFSLLYCRYAVSIHECELFASLNQLQYKYDFWSGCYVNHPKFNWIKLDDFSAILIGK